MSVFIEAITDPFSQRLNEEAERLRSQGRNETPVRRPLRGIQIKEDSYAIIRVLDEEGQFLPVIDAAGEIRPSLSGQQMTTSWTNFIVQTVQEQRQEKQQIVETFGDSYIFFFGESPRILQVQGFLINSADFNWRAEFWENYERYFRGTRLVERSARLYFIYDDIITEGYLLGANATDNSENNNLINFSFSIYVTGYSNISMVGDPNFPKPTGDIDYSEMKSYDEALSQFEGTRNLQSASTVDAVKRANEIGIYLGAAQLLADAIRRGLTDGDSSIMAFMQRAQLAMGLVSDVAGAVIGALFGGGGNPEPFLPTRSTPIRTTFQDNLDEYIGSEVEAALVDASPFSMADQWLKMDQTVETSVLDFFNPSGGEFWDIMGRAGRAAQEIAWRAANADAYLSQADDANASRLFTGPGTATNPANVASSIIRDIPFGMMVTPGGFF